MTFSPAAGIEELPPGTTRTFRGGIVRTTRAYDPAFPTGPDAGFRGTIDEATDAVRHALRESTSLRMLRADVPVGCYLSGGLDSSLVAALGLEAKGSQFCTFSLRFADHEYDETRYQRLMAAAIGSDHHEVVVSRGDIARAFPDVIAHTERPILRTAPAPLYLLSKLVHDAGIKVVLTGEGADEQFAGYDLFREAKVRRFWARQPDSTRRPQLLDRLYPYLQRSPVRQRALSRQFFGQDLGQAGRPGFGHRLRWRGTSALRRLFTPDYRAAADAPDAVDKLLADLPSEFSQWTPLAQDQYLETRTLLSGYLLASQGDRMLMAHSVEGRFPFLDRQVAHLAESLPPSHKLRALDEKHVLKRVGRGLLPDEILQRTKQPYRAPDALSFTDPAAAEWIDEVASLQMLNAAGVFVPAAARQLIEKCFARRNAAQFSNADNMAVVGVLSTQLVHHHFIRLRPRGGTVRLTTLVDRLSVPLAAEA